MTAVQVTAAAAGWAGEGHAQAALRAGAVDTEAAAAAAAARAHDPAAQTAMSRGGSAMASGVSLHGSQPAANQASADTTRLRTPNLRLNLLQQQQLCSPGTSAGGYGLDQRPQSPSSLTALQMHRLRLRGDSPIPPRAQSPGVSVLSAPLARMQVRRSAAGLVLTAWFCFVWVSPSVMR
eukprot:COSAG01_NODE_3018_length_6713_cov_20.002570_2_plen_179_part_00